MVQSPYSSLICLCLPLWSFPPPVELRIPSRFLESLWKINMAFSYKTKNVFTISSVQSLGHVQFFATPWTAASQASLSITNSQSLLRHVHQVSDVIQPSHRLLSPSPPTFNLSQHESLFKWVSSLYQVATSIGVSASASVFPMTIQHWFSLGWTGWISLLSKGLSRAFSNTTNQKHQFFGTQLSL